MKKTIISLIVLWAICPNMAYGAYCAAQCSSYTTFCNDSVLWCGSSGATISNNDSYQFCMPYQGDITTPTSSTYIICFSDGASCKNRNWVTSGTDKEYSAGYTCSAVGATTKAAGGGNKWRCAQGYYSTSSSAIMTGSSSSVISCSQCPSSGGTYGTTASAGAGSKTECYLPSGTTGSDTGGSYTYTGNCYYVE